MRVILTLVYVTFLLSLTVNSSRIVAPSLKVPILSTTATNNRANSLAYIERSPFALLNSFQVSIQSFFSNSVIMIPLCLIVGLFQKHPTRNIWLQKSLRSGIEWGVIASVFSGGEEFLKIFRDTDDIWNRAIASGLASGLVQMRADGTQGFLIGFAQGFGFLVVLDLLTNMDSLSTSPTPKNGKRKSNRK